MLQGIREKIKLKTIIRIIPAALFLIFLYYMMIKNYNGTLRDTVENTKISIEGFTSLSDTFEGTLQNNIYGKSKYINLNGLMTALLGIKDLNDRQKLSNGYLTWTGRLLDVTDASENIIELNNFLSDRNIDFIYLLAPASASIYDAEFAPGYTSEASKNIDAMTDALTAGGVDVIDMDSRYEEMGLGTEDVFFVTDHHWKPEAALKAAKCTMEKLAAKGAVDYSEDLLSDENWNVTVYEDIFLGSHGKRTGTKYAGVDDISVYEPKFPTNYSYSGLRYNTTTWEYHDNLLDMSYTEKADYFNDNPYCIYMYRDYPIRTAINTEAPNDKKILITGDSFKIPYEYFLTTQFKEVYTIDLRYYTDGTLPEYIEEIQPDIVLMCSDENDMTEETVCDFRIEEYLDLLKSQPENALTDKIEIGNASVSAQEDNDNCFSVLYTDLEPNQAYTLTVDSAAYSGGEDWYVQMTLQNLSSNEAVCNRYFDIGSNEKQKWIFETSGETDGVYAIYLYAGTKGHTAGASTEVTGIELYKGIIEE
ncbi:MAG: hypothetical protein LUG66_10145 [Clostridiales bacterium]|nr:hypothetical protein [Clostridiales bacterium]